MKYKTIENGYIVTAGDGKGSIPITEEEYCRILDALAHMPIQRNGFGLRLKNDDLVWESYKVEPIPESDEVNDAEALEILLGGAS